MGIKWRLSLCALLCLVGFAAVFFRLVYLQVFQHQRLTVLAKKEVNRSLSEGSLRGKILDRGGRVLAETVPNFTCYADTTRGAGPAYASQRLSSILDVPAGELQKKLRSVSPYIVLKRKLDFKTAQRIKSLDLPGIRLERESSRFYPNGVMARNVLGTVGLEGKGLSGLEAAFEKILTGRGEEIDLLRDGQGRAIFYKSRKASQTPPDLLLTLDRNIQFYSEQMLEEAVRKAGAKAGMILVQDPKTGDILAAADYPVTPAKNLFIQDIFEPGSTFKIVASLAAIEKGELAEKIVDCEKGSWELYRGVVIHDHEPQGQMSLAGVLRESSNIGTAKIALELGSSPFYRMMRSFGFGSRTGIPLPGESAGIAPPFSFYNRLHLAMASFGQGIGVTALQLLSAYSAVANEGRLMEPRIVRGFSDEDGTFQEYPPNLVRQISTPSAIKRLSRMLEGVVENGTGKGAGISGYSVAGKTGTSQKLDPKTNSYSSSLSVVSFCGFFPASDPKVTILVILDEPKKYRFASEIAAPIFAQLARKVIAWEGIAPDRPINLVYKK